MPGRQSQAPVDEAMCRRCQATEPAIVVRNEPLCKDCFSRYVQTKVVKRMESFRVRNSEPGNEQKLLLPLSFDACSLALLHILSQHLQTQVAKTGRPGYRLLVLHVNEGSPEALDDTEENTPLAALRARYPVHEYHTVSATEVLNLDDVSALLPTPLEADSQDSQKSLSKLFASAKSATSRQDLKQILLRRLVIHQAKAHDCRAIIWEYSTTKLAEQILAETAKARGFALPWAVNDGESPHGIPFYFPLREVLNKEVDAYLSFLEPPLSMQVSKSAKTAVSTRNTTIDDLMAQYFESVEQEFPSIVANVVRTTGKLQSTALAQVEQSCELCNMPLEGQSPARSRLCYGCIRTLPVTVE
ncbi:Putative cytoplasmic tRNA 2-thiolation protein [Septoria linicola]|uniref:Cytoplasmic tRNA 2-thiolation protein 2 n=1 Tax=Septoria linicola TaxID=215465 RepID=A0A9Q9APZ4_9PEZI|nr:putative cytoplasmic tRNA 2-thiolation protein [Septoria linicola]USW49941.1 Putative cytoplasmic tRNA 2-thiolation protein [Septoria linicola]